MVAMNGSDGWPNRSSSSRARRSPTCVCSSNLQPAGRRVLFPPTGELRMRCARLLASILLFLACAPTRAGQAPFGAGAPDFRVSARDRVYAAEQFSNTVSVIDPSSNRNLGVIRLGDPQPMNLSPLYKGQ